MAAEDGQDKGKYDVRPVYGVSEPIMHRGRPVGRRWTLYTVRPAETPRGTPPPQSPQR